MSKLIELAEEFERHGFGLAETARRKLAQNFDNDALVAAKNARDWLEIANALRARASQEAK
jgi:hypothetical protein